MIPNNAVSVLASHRWLYCPPFYVYYSVLLLSRSTFLKHVRRPPTNSDISYSVPDCIYALDGILCEPLQKNKEQWAWHALWLQQSVIFSNTFICRKGFRLVFLSFWLATFKESVECRHAIAVILRTESFGWESWGLNISFLGLFSLWSMSVMWVVMDKVWQHMSGLMCDDFESLPYWCSSHVFITWCRLYRRHPTFIHQQPSWIFKYMIEYPVEHMFWRKTTVYLSRVTAVTDPDDILK